MMRRTQASPILSFIHRHRVLLVWMALYLVFVLFSMHHMPLVSAMLVSLSTITPMVIVSQSLREYLIPRWLHRNVAVYYVLSFLLIVLLTVTAVQMDLHLYQFLFAHQMYDLPRLVRDELEHISDSGHLLLHLKHTFLLLTTMAIVTITRLLEEREALETQMHERQLRNEIRLIRAQINPHFLFNALNCIYTLTMVQDEKAPDSVLKLSSMLRYVVDDCRTEMVSLAKEVAYIRNYIDFQQIRMEHEGDISFKTHMTNPDTLIPPMIFQPIVENCFKHSDIARVRDAFVHLSLQQDASGKIHFETTNSIARQRNTDNERQGIGLNNVRQHLNLLYGARATLVSEEKEGAYRTHLTILA